MLAAEGELAKLRDRLEEHDGSLPTRKLDPRDIIPSQWANRHPDAFKTAEFEALKQDIAAADGNVQPIAVRPLAGMAGRSRLNLPHPQDCIPSPCVAQCIPMVDVPLLEPKLFIAAYERWLAASSGVSPQGAQRRATARGAVNGVSSGQGAELQVRFAAVAYAMSPSERAFSALIARAEAFNDLLNDAERQADWASRGWLRPSYPSAGMLAPRRPLLAIAATCPLRAGAGRFEPREFERRAVHVFEALTRSGAR
jgi:hypothetical protein